MFLQKMFGSSRALMTPYISSGRQSFKMSIPYIPASALCSLALSSSLSKQSYRANKVGSTTETRNVNQQFHRNISLEGTPTTQNRSNFNFFIKKIRESKTSIDILLHLDDFRGNLSRREYQPEIQQLLRDILSLKIVPGEAPDVLKAFLNRVDIDPTLCINGSILDQVIYGSEGNEGLKTQLLGYLEKQCGYDFNPKDELHKAKIFI